MAKVFTITEGIENLGALKSGGQGSVYKARKMGEIITAIKLLPTPISSETEDDKNFTSFQNEVQKLQKVNERSSPNVVSIVASGITSSGNLPYIEMEYIEGPDLAEQLKPPYPPVFTIKEIIKVADHLSNALAHCHQADVKHGDIKSNNVKFNQRTGNYMLLDFGLSAMSDEQRRTSLRRAGAVEFMAPEQNAGEMLFETDVYSFGVIIFELLAGRVPFPLKDRSEMARNEVMLAHIDNNPPDPVFLRRDCMPATWPTEKKEREMQVPGWLLILIDKCLEKKPFQRFRNGADLQEFIHTGVLREEHLKVLNPITTPLVQTPVAAAAEHKELQIAVNKLQAESLKKMQLIEELQEQISSKDQAIAQFQSVENYYTSKNAGVSKSLFTVVLFIALAASGYAIYDTFVTPGKKQIAQVPGIDTTQNISADSLARRTAKQFKKPVAPRKKITVSDPEIEDEVTADTDDTVAVVKASYKPKKYRLLKQSPLYNDPDLKSYKSEWLFPRQDNKGYWYFSKMNGDGIAVNSLFLTPVDEDKGFVCLLIKDATGVSFRRWVPQESLRLVESN